MDEELLNNLLATGIDPATSVEACIAADEEDNRSPAVSPSCLWLWL